MAEPKNIKAQPEISVTGKKLELRKKMGTITLVTPPSFFQNQNRSFCLINLSKKDKDNFADQVNKWFPKEDLTIYLWDDNNFSALDPFGQDDDPEYEQYLENWKPNKAGRDYTWLLNACRAANTVVMNMDYSSNQLKVWSGYILTLSKTWFINSNQDDASSFGVLNRNVFAGMHELFPKIKKLKDNK
jgi:hypothetical protein|tara:strand:+ start:436 stop:996 length:561 start_codon:yes stop_codon:yes gene_type:complete